MSRLEAVPSRLLLLLLGALLLLAPLFRSGKTPLAALSLELLAVAAFLVLWWDSERKPALPLAERLVLWIMALFPLVQLLPLSGLDRADLMGQSDYFLALRAAGVEQATTLTALPRETWLGWFALLVPIAVYLLTRATPVKWLRVLVGVVLGMAASQAVLGLVQFGTYPEITWYLGMELTHFGSAVGTYTSRNNFVGFMYLALMVSLALFMATLGRHKRDRGFANLRARLLYLASPQGHRAFLYGALAFLLLLAIIFSRSRAGIGLTMLGLLLASVAFSRRIGGSNVYGMTGTIGSVVVALAVVIGLGPVLDRFSARDPLSDARFTIFEGVFQGMSQFSPFGSGIGTFRQTFHPFHDLSQAMFTINRAHNSYLEWLYTGGWVAGLLIIAMLTLYFRRWFTVWKAGPWGEFRYVQVGAGMGMALMLLHDLVDYNLFVPANMVYFAFYAGLFFYPYEEPELRKKIRRSKPEPTDAARKPRLQPVPTGLQKNPFMDD